MRDSMTAVLERDGIRLGSDYLTEPYEVAWATQARWFVRVLRWPDGLSEVALSAEISPDGLHWCPLDAAPYVISQAGVFSWPADNFGGWLRLRARAASAQAGAQDTAAQETAATDTGGSLLPALIYLTLKG